MTCLISSHWCTDTGYEPNCNLCKQELIDDLRERISKKDVVAVAQLMDFADKTPIEIPEFIKEQAEEILGSMIQIGS